MRWWLTRAAWVFVLLLAGAAGRLRKIEENDGDHEERDLRTFISAGFVDQADREGAGGGGGGGGGSSLTIPTSFGSVRYVGNNGIFYSRYPLLVCEGDCDSDDDCSEGLYCFARDSNEEVPFCDGGDKAVIGYDVCAWNTSYPEPPPLPRLPFGAFHIKLYWEEGYYWQNETLDREWCMVSNYDGYPGSGVCWYGLEERNCTSTQLYIGKCLSGDERQWFFFDDLGSAYSGSQDHREVLIKTLDNHCLYRRASAIYVTTECDPNDPTQRFFALSGSFTPSSDPTEPSRFEIGQYLGYTLDNCLTNAHHPKSGEVVEFHVCEAARAHDDQTSYWELLRFPGFTGSLSNVARRSGNTAGSGAISSNKDNKKDVP